MSGMPRRVLVAVLVSGLVCLAPHSVLADGGPRLRLEIGAPAPDVLLRVEPAPRHSWRLCVGVLAIVLASMSWAGGVAAATVPPDPGQNPDDMRTAAIVMGASGAVLLVGGLLLIAT